MTTTSLATTSRPRPVLLPAAVNTEACEHIRRRDLSAAQLRRLDRQLLSEIADHEPAMARASDRQLEERALRLQLQAVAGTDLDRLLPECFAIVRETARRQLGERPYDEQMIAGLGLHRGKLVEMQTGEGKTLAAVAPVVLNAVTGHGVHVLTFNDYLARRDAEWMGPIYRQLGLSVACVQEGMSTAERHRAYRADVTYLTVKEAGFDCLRDRLCLAPDRQVQRPFHLALVDEADSILIDESRIPLVIAGSSDAHGGDLRRLAEIARRLEPRADFDTDAHRRNIFLTERGAHRCEEMLGCGNLFAGDSISLQAELRNALHAEALLSKDVDYIVRNGRVELVDELTGRVAENRHWPDGLQAAIEAKEGLHLQPEGMILGSITIQHFVQRYPNLCGMTATALPAARELREVYGLEVVSVPTHRPCIRRDDPDRLFADKRAKRRALIDEIAAVHGIGRPILVGTVSVGESEELAAELHEAGVSCRVLNARNDNEEAAIIAEAGAVGAVTISTNMAGRGTDIRLGGSGESQREQVLALGGLSVIGCNRHESRRIDDQLRGRAGRQGDPGSTCFFTSLEDDLLQRFGIEEAAPKEAHAAEPQELSHSKVHREVDHVQRVAEGENGDIRKRLLEYARLLECQYGELHEWRQEVLEQGVRESHLAASCPQRWHELAELLGQEELARVEQRITLLAIDRCWSEHLAEMQALRDEVHLFKLGGRDPLTEFYRTAATAFDEGIQPRIDDTIDELFSGLVVTADGVDWDASGLRGPSSTWTYLVNDNVFGGNFFLSLANSQSMALWAVLLWAPLLFVWALVLRCQRWLRHRRERSAPAEEHSDQEQRPDR